MRLVPPRLACLTGVGRVGPNGVRPNLVPGAGGYMATLRCDFKLRGFADWVQWIFTRQRAPWAWAQLDYGLQFDPRTGAGQSSLLPSGAHVPSNYPYLGWFQAMDGIHDMLGNAQSDIDAFIETGACVPGPPRRVGAPIIGVF